MRDRVATVVLPLCQCHIVNGRKSTEGRESSDCLAITVRAILEHRRGAAEAIVERAVCATRVVRAKVKTCELRRVC